MSRFHYQSCEDIRNELNGIKHLCVKHEHLCRSFARWKSYIEQNDCQLEILNKTAASLRSQAITRPKILSARPSMFLFISFWTIGSVFTQYSSFYPSYYSNYYNTYNYPQYSSNLYNGYSNYPYSSYGYNGYYNNYNYGGGGNGWSNQFSSSGPGGCAPGYAKTCILGVCRVQCGNVVYDNPRDEEISILNKFG
ncbi:hypothetical protein DdX_17286 [Ditylenchus destructor]|uniref:Uncharacterized protein n=1 Tax=Ditylenchus destructor TaxID=166010 RepID=A0AAD4QZA3_9BILA|nr:hypothetical protein DdX_17286 [Ditylenchus destructor]